MFDFRDLLTTNPVKIWPLPLLPLVPETLPRWELTLSQGPSSLSTPCDYLLQGRPPYFSVYF